MIFFFLLFSLYVEAKGIPLSCRDKFCGTTSDSIYFYYGGRNKEEFLGLNGNNLTENHLNRDSNIVMLGFINIYNDIYFNDNHKFYLTFGTLDNLTYEGTYIKGVNNTIFNVTDLKIMSWGTIVIENLNFYNVKNVVMDEKGYTKTLTNIRFTTTNNLNYILRSKDTNFTNVSFELVNKGKLNLILREKNINVEGEPLNILGTTNAQANIFMEGKPNEKANINLVGLISGVKTNININYSILNIKNKISLSGQNNYLIIQDSLLKGKVNFHKNYNLLHITNSNLINSVINFYGKENNLILNNTNLDKNSIINFHNSGNFITIEKEFLGNLKFFEGNNNITFNKANVKNASIYIAKDTSLRFYNSFINKDSTLYFAKNSNNKLVFQGSVNYGNINFYPNSINTLILKEGSKNILGGVITLNDNSLLNINIEKNSTTHLCFEANKPINSLILGANNKIIIHKNGLKTNKLLQQGDVTWAINMDNSISPTIYAHTNEFNSSKIYIDTYNTPQNLTFNNDTKEIVLLKSDTTINNLQNIYLNSKLFEYQVIYKKNTIVISLKKTKDFVDFFINQPLNNYSYKKENILNLTRYLDKLWKAEYNSPHLSSLLDYISNISNNNDKMVNFLTSLFPVSNKALYHTILNNYSTLINEINSCEDPELDFPIKLMNKIYYNKANFLVDNAYITNNGKGILYSIDYLLNPHNKLGAFISMGMNVTQENSYNINLLNTYIGGYYKLRLFNRLTNINIVNVGGNKFFIDRFIYKDDYQYPNNSSPLALNYGINTYWGYDINLLTTNWMSYVMVPELNMYLGRVHLESYSESGEVALTIKGDNIFNFNIEGGILNKVIFNTTNYNKNTLYFNIATGYQYDTLKPTTFRFKASNTNTESNLNDSINHASYLKLNLTLVSSPASEKYGLNLNWGYKISKKLTNINFSLGLYLKV